ncbi:2-amino-4-oxopentanoate thiolase subunit OrtB [Vagococcus carniphilus]|uniref:2-amino-4-oxopentanoate thiolase subunit OrtB n=1 Tax=Vagococcus carniphilus TaxID=218144 RepID=A0A430B8B4_9ENTE|nr:2-amino-4-oxopentanoate thiolase subunit OrtB [Vagococcus carniphilus]MDT2814253.1 2-amino-4-oxopentanoate thiolase subunit OrtB [Vagococcus carniphilus]MDT2829371.1 2-amino-4-oxopentanoate thiolase subunit OrtB [Vagococcus carniphilus]MDT2833422.1 2-amino-4-oxopentanoate thiolase subunit OrtB [Vagococcus carniphilus]MDT2838830.1 2-amino-4-oxopentanoate thiolase subunit OrtB [Vagococcus carniphilus]MDT2849114.1 2-amino-4-oxopentanoate thiolase subunit OrtB [Vagococcus carniphilus]
MSNNSYKAVMDRKNQIVQDSLKVNYDDFKISDVAFDYERMMEETGYSIDEMIEIQSKLGVGNTPIVELKNISALSRKYAPKGKGARIFVKDEAANASGSFKDRRAAVSCYHAKKLGYTGVVTATSGNYGAAVASHAAKLGLKCIVVQECFDSKGVGQPEIVEKARKCEALGAEVVQLTVGPELFYQFLQIVEDTGYFNASLYTPFGIAGVETLGYEIVKQFDKEVGKQPDVVVATNAGGGNLTGTARGLRKAGNTTTKVVAASVDLTGLHMASDGDFNRKSFTTGHTGFGVPFTTGPDRSDVPRSAARPLRYMDRYVTMSQGEVFYITEMLANLEGLEKGPAGNTSLAAAFAIAQEMDEDQIILVQETEYTGAGKTVQPQLSFARENGVDIKFGNPREEKPGVNIILPESPKAIEIKDVDLNRLKRSAVKNATKGIERELTAEEFDYLAEEINDSVEKVKSLLEELKN